MATDPLTKAEHNKIVDLMAAATAAGRDPIEELNRSGYLLTSTRIFQVRIEAAEELAAMVDRTPAHVVLKKHGAAGNLAEDYRKALIDELDETITAAKERWTKR